jgi:hypothetical protein
MNCRCAHFSERTRYQDAGREAHPCRHRRVRDLLEHFPADLEIELETRVPLKVKTVGDLRSLPTWPTDLRLIYNQERGLMRED